MDMFQIVVRSISGYIFVIPVILAYYLYLRKTGKGQTGIHTITAFLFCYYLIGILTMTGIHEFHSFSPRIVLIPFRDMLSGPVDTILNIFLFLPLGFFLPLLYGRYRCIRRIVLTGFLLSLSIELMQMFGMGATDINDLITNTAGACLGYCLYKAISKLTAKELLDKFQASGIDGRKEVLCVTIYAFIIMVTIQPLVISKLFSLG